MIWRVVCRYAELTDRPAALETQVASGMLDGLFQQALLADVAGHPDVLATLARQVHAVMPLTLEPSVARSTPVDPQRWRAGHLPTSVHPPTQRFENYVAGRPVDDEP